MIIIIESLQDYNSLQAASEESLAQFVTQKEVLAIEEPDDEYDGATNIFEILDDEINNKE